MYAKRNLPLARGRWKDGSDHFKLIVVSGRQVELLVFGKDSRVVRIFRLTKTFVPDLIGALKGLALPFGFAVVLIFHRVWHVQRYIAQKTEPPGSGTPGEPEVAKEKSE
jgi:hypothetical protein